MAVSTSSGGNVDQQLGEIFNSPAGKENYVYTLRAWPLLYATALTTAGAVIVGLTISLLSAIFIVEFAPARMRQVLEPVVRLLAAVPSVIPAIAGPDHVPDQERARRAQAQDEHDPDQPRKDVEF